MIPVMMHSSGLDLQSAVDAVGELCRASVDRFIAGRASIPSWGPEIDRDVDIYVQGLQDWIVGSLHWSFKSERYFGKEGAEIKSTRQLTLQGKQSRSSRLRRYLGYFRRSCGNLFHQMLTSTKVFYR